MSALVLSLMILAQLSAHAFSQRPAAIRVGDCRRLIAAVQRADNDAQMRILVAKVRNCGQAGDSGIAQAIRVTRAAPGQVLTEQLNPLALTGPNGPIVDALIEIATDGSAPDANRLIAIAALHNAVRPQYHADPDFLRGGLDRYGLPVNGCARRSLVGRPATEGATPLTRQRILEAALRNRSEPALSPDMLSGSVCLASAAS